MHSNQAEGFLATPLEGHGKPVLVLHAWWGLNETIKDICRRLADQGFVSFAPDLYHGRIATTIPEAEELGRDLDSRSDQAKKEVRKAMEYVSEKCGVPESDIAAIGFSLGGAYALDLSASAPDRVRKVVLFYGVGAADFSKAKAEYLGHFAENDPYEKKEYVDWLEGELRQSGRTLTFYTYPGTGHWFCEPDRTETYDEAAARLAWARTLEFLRRR